MTDAESRGGDVFVSKVSNNKWRTPEPFGKPINTTYWEGGACISPDGKTRVAEKNRRRRCGQAVATIFDPKFPGFSGATGRS